MDNIWHTLAENALNGKYDEYSSSGNTVCGDMFIQKHLTHFIRCEGMDDFYLDMNSEEQCLFLLFCGESYESSNS